MLQFLWHGYITQCNVWIFYFIRTPSTNASIRFLIVKSWKEVSFTYVVTSGYLFLQLKKWFKFNNLLWKLNDIAFQNLYNWGSPCNNCLGATRNLKFLISQGKVPDKYCTGEEVGKWKEKKYEVIEHLKRHKLCWTNFLSRLVIYEIKNTNWFTNWTEFNTFFVLNLSNQLHILAWIF